MDEDQKFWLFLVITVVLGLTTTIIGCSYLDNQNKKNFITAGYEQVQRGGSTDYFWQKVKVPAPAPVK